MQHRERCERDRPAEQPRAASRYHARRSAPPRLASPRLAHVTLHGLVQRCGRYATSDIFIIHFSNLDSKSKAALSHPFFGARASRDYARSNLHVLERNGTLSHFSRSIASRYVRTDPTEIPLAAQWTRPSNFSHRADSQLLPYMGIKRKQRTDWSVGRLAARFSKCRFKSHDTESVCLGKVYTY